jgi:sec-independent protein translocase protein TatA
MGSALLSPAHVVLVLVVVLMAFGPKRLPDVGRSLGDGLRGFRESLGGKDGEPERDALPERRD